jgi:sigma-E factor negative regulatory protein RseB
VNRTLRRRRGLTGRGAVLVVAAAAVLITAVAVAGGEPRPRPQTGPQAPWLPARPTAAVPGRVSNAALATGMRLLDQAVRAARQTSYQGLQVISWRPVGGRGWLAPRAGTVTVEVWHRQGAGMLTRVTAPAGGTWLDLAGSASGSPAAAMFGLTPALISLLGTHYSVVSSGTGSAGGRAARIVEVVRADGGVAAQFWLDRVTALPLRRVIFDTGSRVISDDGFDQLKLGAPAGAASSPADSSSQAAAAAIGPAAASRVPAGGAAGPPAIRPWADRLGSAQLAALRARGWPVPRLLPGDLTLFDASQAATATGHVVDLAYSDGLSVISLFVQRGQLPAALPGWHAADLDGNRLYVKDPGEPDLTWSAGGFVFTVVAAAPAPTVAAAVNALPHQAEPGFWGRMRRGMLRLVSWLNPFR